MYKTGGRVWQLSRECMEDSKRWFPDTASSLIQYCLGLAGETGEFIDIIKKVHRGSKDIQNAVVKRQLAMELTDAFIYILNLAALLGIDLEETYKLKRAENEKRFGNGG